MDNMYLNYRQPARKQTWEQALPLGNGTLGAMIFGTTDGELIQLNQDSVWSGGFRQRINPDARKSLDRVRQLIFAGRLSEAEQVIYTDMLSVAVEQGDYEPLADLKLIFDKKIPHYSELFKPKQVDFQNYTRTLDLEQALFTCSYDRNLIHYHREAFMSYPGQVLAYRIQTSMPIGLRIELTRGNSCEQICATEDRITLSGEGNGNGPVFVADLLAVSNGKQRRTGFFLDIEEATEIVIYVAGRTSFYEADPFAWCEKRLSEAKEKGYEKLKETHLKDYIPLFERMQLKINPDTSDTAARQGVGQSLKSDETQGLEDTAQRLEAYKISPTDDGLLELYFNYGRYLTIASSRPGSLPSNLQGLWNKEYKPQWGSRYTANINLQMNYWPVEAANLSECHLPLFDHLQRMLPNGQKVAREMYGCRGAVAHHNTDIYGDCAPQGAWMPASIWPMGLAWLSTHITEHFRYTHDVDFAKKYYVVLEQASLFFIDYLVLDADGYLVTCPSTSPENTYILDNGEKSTVCFGPTMDTQIIRDLWTGYLEVAEALIAAGMLSGGDYVSKGLQPTEDSDITIEELTDNIQKKLKLLMPVGIGSCGQLLEWTKEYEEWEKGHRHISHLYGLYPANQITKSMAPELYAAAEKTILERLSHGGGQTGWSRGWMINMWARLGNGEAAYQNLQQLLQQQTASNLFDLHPAFAPGMPPIFQIDGNHGGTAGILEMLLQSHEDFLNFLPAVPKKWKSGAVKGLKTRGNIQVDMEWSDHRVTRITLHSLELQSIRLFVNGLWKELCFTGTKEIYLD